jgi:undecaprenyl-diphosphatase
MMTDLSSLGSLTVLITASLAAIGYVLFHRQWAAALLLLAALASGQALSAALKLLVEQPRPEVVPGFVDVYTLSFPSGHAMLSAVTYLTMAALAARVERRRLVRIYFIGTAVLLTVLIGFSRIYLGVHWPSDVLGGWIIGVAWALSCWSVMTWLQRRGQVEKPN